MATLFDGVLFHLSSSLPVERSAELKGVLLQNGAKQAKSIHTATHIITDTNNFEGGQDVAAQVAVVTVRLVLYKLSLLSDWRRLCGSNAPSF